MLEPNIYDGRTWLMAVAHGVRRAAGAVAIGTGAVAGQTFLSAGDTRTALITISASAATGAVVGFFGYLGGLSGSGDATETIKTTPEDEHYSGGPDGN